MHEIVHKFLTLEITELTTLAHHNQDPHSITESHRNNLDLTKIHTVTESHVGFMTTNINWQ